MTRLDIFGKQIREKRIALGMTQDELAKKVGYTSRSSINKLELGYTDPSLSKIEALAEALGTTTIELLYPDSALYDLNDGEQRLIDTYRSSQELGARFDLMVKGQAFANGCFYTAAHSENNTLDNYVNLDSDVAQRLKDSPETDDPLL